MDFKPHNINPHCIYFCSVHAQGKKSSISHSLLTIEPLPALPSGPPELLLELSAAGKTESSSLWTQCKTHEEGKSNHNIRNSIFTFP